MDQPVLAVEAVSKSFGDIHALRALSLSIQAGEFVALLGPNGAGKSTLLQLLTGLFSPDAGRISVLGHDLSRHATRALADIGVVFQQQTLDLELSVRANLLFHADLHGIPRPVAKARVAQALETYGLVERARTRVRALSGGNRRRVELARALMHEPRVLLMDEATVGLDPNSRQSLLEEMVRLKTERRLGILWATHLIDEVEYADRMIMLNKGEIVFEGTPQALLERENASDLTATVTDLLGQSDPTLEPAGA